MQLLKLRRKEKPVLEKLGAEELQDRIAKLSPGEKFRLSIAEKTETEYFEFEYIRSTGLLRITPSSDQWPNDITIGYAERITLADFQKKLSEQNKGIPLAPQTTLKIPILEKEISIPLFKKDPSNAEREAQRFLRNKKLEQSLSSLQKNQKLRVQPFTKQETIRRNGSISPETLSEVSLHFCAYTGVWFLQCSEPEKSKPFYATRAGSEVWKEVNPSICLPVNTLISLDGSVRNVLLLPSPLNKEEIIVSNPLWGMVVPENTTSTLEALPVSTPWFRASLGRKKREYTGTTEEGSFALLNRVRPGFQHQNEDGCIVTRTLDGALRFYGLDGAGGLDLGKVWMRIVAKEIIRESCMEETTFSQVFQSAGDKAFQKIKKRYKHLCKRYPDLKRKFSRLESALSVAGVEIQNGRCCIHWGGDTKVFIIRRGEVYWETPEFNIAFEKFREGEISEISAFFHPERGILSGGLWIREGKLKNELSGVEKFSLEKDDLILVTSDEGPDNLASELIARIVSHEEDLLKALLKLDHYTSFLNQNGVGKPDDSCKILYRVDKGA